MARRPTPIIDAAVEKFKENRPMVGAIVEGLRNAAANRNNSLKPEEVETVANEVVATMARDPIVQSQTNGEPWYKNRVRIGIILMAVSSGLKVFNIDLGMEAEDQKLIEDIIFLGGGTIAAIGEWLSRRLSHIDWKRPWTIFGFGTQS